VAEGFGQSSWVCLSKRRVKKKMGQRLEEEAQLVRSAAGRCFALSHPAAAAAASAHLAVVRDVRRQGVGQGEEETWETAPLHSFLLLLLTLEILLLRLLAQEMLAGEGVWAVAV